MNTKEKSTENHYSWVCQKCKKIYPIDEWVEDIKSKERSNTLKEVEKILDDLKFHPLELEDGHETRGLDINELKQSLAELGGKHGIPPKHKCSGILPNFI